MSHLSHLRTFLEAYRSGSFSKAAELLGITQPAASQHIQWICPYISRHLLSLNPLLACCRRYSRGER